MLAAGDTKSTAPDAHNAIRTLTVEEARRLVSNAYEIVLNRMPDPAGLDEFVIALTSERLDLLGVVRELLTSDEAEARFAAAASPRSDDLSSEVTEAYRIVLRRLPEKAAVDNVVARFSHGNLRLSDFYSELLQSEEFARNVAQHPAVARHVARTVIETLMDRDPGEEAVAAYSGALQNGYRLADFLRELIDSDEFASRMNLRMPVNFPIDATIPDEIAWLLQDLIAAKLVNEGCRLAVSRPLPPSELSLSAHKIASLIRTLSMLGDQPGSSERPVTGADTNPE